MSADAPLPGGFSGKIHYTLVAESPILIGAPDPEDETVSVPMRLGRAGPWVLPGATMRGLMRSVSEIVAYARLTPVNKHHRYGLRDSFIPISLATAVRQADASPFVILERGFCDRLATGIPRNGMAKAIM
eukprot:jgi/Tetstr1/435300/TSEL_024219.t1